MKALEENPEENLNTRATTSLLEKIDISDVPKNVSLAMQNYLENGKGSGKIFGETDNVYTFENPTRKGEKVTVYSRHDEIPNESESRFERVWSIFETLENGDIAGGGEIKQFISGEPPVRIYEPNNPYVGWTENSKSTLGQGRGAERLLLMNIVIEAQAGKNVRSGELNEYSVKVWEELLTQGKARKIQNEKGGTVAYEYVLHETSK